MDIVNNIKKDTNNSNDIKYKIIKINNKIIYFIFSEVLCNGEYINEYVLKRIEKLENKNNLYESIFNTLPCNSITEIFEYKDILKYIFQGFLIILVEGKILIVEARSELDRNITSTESEYTPFGSKDALTENINKNLGLIRKRIRTNNLTSKEYLIGNETNTKVFLLYMENITSKDLIKNIEDKLKNINTKGILDIGYIQELILNKEKIFPTSIISERPDTASQALLEGKIVILTDNTPYSLIIPSFFIDYFHTPDDYYQNSINTTFIRLIRLLCFITSIFLPGLYIAITTLNPESISLNLLLNFQNQRLGVPFPGFIEALIMILSFEILRESDARIPSKLGSSVSILGGLILGDAAVNAGILSPIMIIVISISMISGLVFTTNSLINPIRLYRIIVLLLSAFLGLYGLFLGLMLLIIKISSINTFNYSYIYPFSPFYKNEIKDSFLRFKKTNKKRGKNNE